MIGLIAALLAVVTTPYAPVSYACDGSTAAFTVNFPYLSSSDLTVTSTTAGGVVTTLSLTTDFTTNVVSTTSTAVLTVLAPATKCPAGSTLKISRTMACTQPQVFRQQTSFDPRLVESASDRVLMCAQQVQAQVAGTQNVNFAGNNTFVGLQTFTSGNAIDGPVLLTPQAVDPITPANGEVWLNSTQNAAKIRVNGASNIFSGNPMLLATTSATSIPGTGAATIAIFTTVVTDTDSGYSVGTGRYTVPTGKGGHYLVTCAIDYTAALTASNVSISVVKNASNLFRTFAVNTAAFQSISATGVLPASAGDLIDCRAVQNSGGASVLSGATDITYFSVKRLSD